MTDPQVDAGRELDAAERCEGTCADWDEPECVGPVTKVEIVECPPSASRTWRGPTFDYCQTAIQIDREKGFTVRAVRADTEGVDG